VEVEHNVLWVVLAVRVEEEGKEEEVKGGRGERRKR
jgi:hypothetical protein